MNRFSKNIPLIFYLIFCCTITIAQQHKPVFTWPIDSPLVLTGNYGELRPNHFHAGIDFSTNGKENLPVLAAADGYVSRVRVSPGGYGKCIYITHPGGFVSVYGHLNSFSLEIDKLVKNKMLELHTYEVDFMPSPEDVKVSKRQVIGLSGNTGGSSGPHLHFEIRDEKSEVPLNPLQFFETGERLAPVLSHIAFYDLTDTLNPKLLKYKKVINPRDSSPGGLGIVKLPQSIIGFAFAAEDRQRYNGSANVVYSTRLYFDNKLIYSQNMDHIAFSDSRFVNEYSQVVQRLKFQKCFQPSLFPSGFYTQVFNKGRILVSDTNLHELKLVLVDEAGNTSTNSVQIKATAFNFFRSIVKGPGFVDCSKDQLITENGISVFFSVGSLYNSGPVSVVSKLTTQGSFTLQPANMNLATACQLAFIIPEKFRNAADKCVLRTPTGFVGPVFRNDSLYFGVKNFGAFLLETDTTGPQLSLVYSRNRPVWKNDRVTFKMKDNKSGIKKFDLYLNETWVLAEYDSKSDEVYYLLQQDTPLGMLRFRLEAEDRCGNKTVLHRIVKR